MKDSTKLLYSGIYILLLLTVFILFAAIKNSSGGTILSYISIFIILALGSLLYYQAVKKSGHGENTLNESNQVIIEAQNEISDQVEEKKVIEEESQIDVQKLLPSRTLGIDKFSEELLQNMAKSFNMVQGLFYIKNPNEDLFHCHAQYAYFSENKPVEFRIGETLSGQAVKNKTIVSLSNIPDQYMTIASGLGKSNPNQLVFVPLKNQDDVVGLIEYATFEPLSDKQFKALEGVSKKVADTIIKHFKK